MKTWSIRHLCSFVLMACAAQFAQAASYVVDSVSVKDLGTLGGEDSWAFDINNRGQIVGFAQDATMKRLAVRWSSSGVISDFGMPDSSAFSYAEGINDHGEIVGRFGDPGGRVAGGDPGRWPVLHVGGGSPVARPPGRAADGGSV